MPPRRRDRRGGEIVAATYWAVLPRGYRNAPHHGAETYDQITERYAAEIGAMYL
jgi:hypothetical protein